MGHKTSTRQVIRQRSSLWLAAISAVTGLLLLLSLVRNWASYPRLSFAAWVLFGLAVAWAVFVRPAVLLDASGVTLRNIVRDVHIPWTRLTGVTSRWNLKVLVGDRGYNAWAISAKVERRKSASAAMLRLPLPGRPHGAASGGAGPSVTAPEATAQSVALLITAAKQEYDESVVQGELPAAPDARVRITWVPLVVAVVLLPAVLVVVLSLT
jgi:hypothetical protein